MILDAPWIRDAELNGYPEKEFEICPVCGKECDTYYIAASEIIGCEHCYREEDDELPEETAEIGATAYKKMWEG